MSTGSDYAFELAIGHVLRFGIILSSGCLAVGSVLELAIGNTPFSGALLSAGVGILLATPGVRIFVVTVMYARERNWLFVGLTLIVAAELVASLIAALDGS